MKKRILFYGDSNTYGFDPRGFFGGRYDREIIWTNILSNNQDWEILRYGENGREIPHNSYQFQELDKTLEKEKNLDCFAVMLGTNDILVMYNVDVEKVALRMKELIHFVISNENYNENTRFLLISPVKMKLGNGELEKMFSEISAKIGKEYQKLAISEKINFVDADKWNIELAYDGIHFSENGHKQFAEKMKKVLNNILSI